MISGLWSAVIWTKHCRIWCIRVTMILARLPRLPMQSLMRCATHPHTAIAPVSLRFLSSLPSQNDPRMRRSPLPATSAFLAASQSMPAISYSPLAMRVRCLPPSLISPVASMQVRPFSRRSGRNPWEDFYSSSQRNGGWLDTVKTGALLAVGAGAVVAFASVGFGFIVFGAAGYGVYSLYRKFFAPYRSNDPFGSVQSEIDRVFNQRKHGASRSPSANASDLDGLVDGLPFMVRGLVKTLFSVVGGAMKSSMARAGELRRMANERLRANASITSQLGSNVSISTPQNWMEYTVNGAGRVEAVFPIVGEGFAQAQVTAKASVDSNGALQLQELKYRNLRSGEVIDLLRDSPASGPRKRVVEAEYVDLDSRK